MTFPSHGHASIAFAATHLEFILSYRQPKSPLGIRSDQNLEQLKASLSRAYAVPEVPCFDDLLTAIDEADEAMVRSAIHDLR